MKAKWMLCILISAAVLSVAGTLFGQEKKEDMPSQDEMMQKMMAAATPGAPHKKLDVLAGSWAVQAKSWSGGHEQPPQSWEGSSDNQWILGGRYLQQTHQAQFMGMPFNGFGLTGYDNMKKKYQSIWVDNLGTTISFSEGEMDASGKVLTMYGTMDDPGTGEMNKKVKYVTRIVSPDEHVFEIHDLSLQPANTKVVEITYLRKK